LPCRNCSLFFLRLRPDLLRSLVLAAFICGYQNTSPPR
jgi:hypothetical protein